MQNETKQKLTKRTKGKMRTILKKASNDIRELYYKGEINIDTSIDFAGKILSMLKNLAENY